MNDFVDLHIHTSHSSDGDHGPLEILQMARDIGLRAISITDHDSVGASRIALQCCRDYDLEVLPAVEITTFFRGRELHILSYFIDIAAPGVIAQLATIREFDEARSQQLILLLNGMGIDVDYDEVKAVSPHAAAKCSVIVKAAMTNGRNVELPIFQDYFDGRRSDQPYHNFFLDYMRPGGVAYVEPSTRYPTTAAIELSLSYGGVPVLAHPGGSLTLPDDVEIIDQLRSRGLSGLEVYSSYHTAEQDLFLGDYCSRHDLVVTAGSDFHGATVKPNIRLGVIPYNPYVLVEALQERRRALLCA
ncbi:MAG TPA: PHP domain-containing protein [Pyrinomonadaceae bacterium]|nr:PHP domain-containing protein [Pyrinomonadaceae bacterium]